MTELLETITMKQLGQILHPIVIVNTNHYFDPFMRIVESMVEQHFIRDIHIDIFSVVSEPEEVLDAIHNAPEWDGSKIKYAPV